MQKIVVKIGFVVKLTDYKYIKASTPIKIIPKKRKEEIKTRAVTTLGLHS